MITTRKGRNARYALLLTICAAMIGYFAYHAVEGDHGLHKRTMLSEKIKRLEAELRALKEERVRVEHDVALVTTRAREEPDLLDEQARALLNYTKPDEIVVLRAKQ
jgi:cell division protein FtsB